MNLKGKAGIVTGGNSGIGEAIVKALASRGMNLVIAGRRREENERVAGAASESFGIRAVPVAADLSREDDCLTVVEAAVEAFGGIDLLVNNAGIGNDGKRIAESSSESFERIMRTNAFSAYWCSREAYKRMLQAPEPPENGLRGAIINIASVLGVEAWAGSGAYATSKHAMMGLTRAMADEGAADGIRVAAVCPALVATPMTGVEGPEYITPDDISETVLYLLGLSAAAWPVRIVVDRRGAD